MFRIVRQTPTLRLEVVCPNGDYLWPTPTQLADWTACPLCAMFTGRTTHRETRMVETPTPPSPTDPAPPQPQPAPSPPPSPTQPA
jgi:hypothetical protein